MDMKKARQIIALAVGMKRYEWLRIAHEINREFEQASARIELSQADAEGIMRMLEIEAHE